MTKIPNENHGELLTSVGLVPTAEALPGEVGVSTVERAERAVHLSETLNYYDTADLLLGQIRMYEDKDWFAAQEQRFGKNVVYKMRRQASEKHQRMLDNARSEFDAAYGVQNLIENNPTLVPIVRLDADQQYAAFESTFRGSTQARTEKRAKMRNVFSSHILGETAVTAEVEPLEDSSDVQPYPPKNPRAKISLARALRPAFMELQVEDYKDISEVDLWLYRPATFRQALLNVPTRTPNALRNFAEDGSTYIRTVFSPAEWSAVLRTSPIYPAQAAVNSSERAQRREARKDPDYQEDADAPRRAGIKVNKALASSMTDYTNGILNPSLDLIKRFREANQYNAGLSRFGNEVNMYEQQKYLWDFVIGDMVWATRLAKRWSREKEDEANRSLQKAIIFAETPELRRDRFGLLLDVAEEWLAAKQGYLRAKTAEAQNYVYLNQTEEERHGRA